MAKTDIWMPIYIGDYLADTGRLNTEQHGAYFLMIMDYWRNGPLPDNATTLASITRMSIDAWSINQAVLMQFFSIENGVWRNERIDQQLLEARQNKDKSQTKAKAAAAARWDKDKKDASSNASSNAQEMLNSCPSPSSSPLSSSSPATAPKPSKENLKNTVGFSDDVVEIFDYWKLKLQHPQAKLDVKRERAVKARLKDGYTVGQLCQAIDGCSLSPWHLGQNDRNQRYDDLELICRDAGRVDRFIEISKNPPMTEQQKRESTSAEAYRLLFGTKDEVIDV